MIKNIDEKKIRNVNFKIEEKLFRQFKAKITKNNITITGFLIKSIKQYLRKEHINNVS